MIGTTRRPRRSSPAFLAWAALLIYLPVCLGLTVDLLDAAHGGDLAPCGCDGDCCCGAPCCAPPPESCCETPATSCCDEPVPSCCQEDAAPVCDAAPIEGRYRWDVACTCGLDDARDRALLASGDVHVPPARAVVQPVPAADRRSRPADPQLPTRPLDLPDPVPKTRLLA